jgi:outer membrane protein OmpA-like peptidoglycan-associated protein
MLHENNSEPNELERADNGEITDKFENELRTEVKSWQMPANLVATEFGEVNVWRHRSEVSSETAECRVEFTIAMEPQGKFAEGWRTGLALDASASMKRAYGRKVEARVDPELLTDYIKQGRLRAYLEDGEPIRKIQREAFAEIQERGYEINYTENILQPLVQDFTAYLAGSLDGTGKTSLIYWGCGKGDEIQVLGEFDHASCQQLAIAGPATFKLGKTTKLLPAIAYFANQYHQAQRGIYIFLTDGRIDDLEQVKHYTKELALEITVGKRNYLKLILIGIGNDVDRYQLQELDDFDTGLDIDIWDYKIASEMTSLSQIFAEVVNENQIIAESGSIYDDAGNCVKSYANGLPAKVDFVMRDDSQWFELEVGKQRIRQSVALGAAMAIAPLAQKKLFDFEIQAQEGDAVAQESNAVLVDQSMAVNQAVRPSRLWKILAALLIGAAFIGTAIAFGILIKRSDDNKLQNQVVPDVIKESVLPSRQASSDQSIDNSSTQSLTRSPKSNPNSADKVIPSKNINITSNNPSNNSSSNSSGKLADKSSSSTAATNSGNTSVDNSKKSSDNAFKTNSGNTSDNNLQKEPSKNTAGSFVKITGEIAEKNAFNNFLKANIDSSGNNSGKVSSDNLRNNAGNLPDKSSIKLSGDSSTSKPTSFSNTNNSVNSANSVLPSKNSDRNVSTSILPITNPDLEVTLFFPSDESQLMPTEETKIDNFWAKVQGRRGIIQVSGHTDTTGDYAYNLDLSQARANEVVRLLRDRGLDNNYKVTFEALSWLQPLRKNNTATDNAFNRRVVLQFKEQR